MANIKTVPGHGAILWGESFQLSLCIAAILFPIEHPPLALPEVTPALGASGLESLLLEGEGVAL